jgi:hypothetical protein
MLPEGLRKAIKFNYFIRSRTRDRVGPHVPSSVLHEVAFDSTRLAQCDSTAGCLWVSAIQTPP